MNPNQNNDHSTPLTPQDQTPHALSPDGAGQTRPEQGAATVQHNNSGLIVLEWLTYAFWGWTVLALSSLTVSVLASFINKADTGDFTPYAIAAVLVLLPLSFVCDLFYSRKEPHKKTGGTMAVMVIHAVLFALFGIGSLIVAVFSVVSMLTDAGDTKDQQVALYSALIIAVLYGATFLRTMNPPKPQQLRKFYRLGMLVSVGVIAILGIMGPVARERSLRDDKLIEINLNTVQDSIDAYARDHDRLPDSLQDLTIEGDAKILIDRKLVDYKSLGTDYVEGLEDVLNNSRSGQLNIGIAQPTFAYELCVTFKEESSGYSGTRDNTFTDKTGYSTYLSIYNHPAGRQCYKLKTTNYY